MDLKPLCKHVLLNPHPPVMNDIDDELSFPAGKGQIAIGTVKIVDEADKDMKAKPGDVVLFRNTEESGFVFKKERVALVPSSDVLAILPKEEAKARQERAAAVTTAATSPHPDHSRPTTYGRSADGLPADSRRAPADADDAAVMTADPADDADTDKDAHPKKAAPHKADKADHDDANKDKAKPAHGHGKAH